MMRWLGKMDIFLVYMSAYMYIHMYIQTTYIYNVTRLRATRLFPFATQHRVPQHQDSSTPTVTQPSARAKRSTRPADQRDKQDWTSRMINVVLAIAIGKDPRQSCASSPVHIMCKYHCDQFVHDWRRAEHNSCPDAGNPVRHNRPIPGTSCARQNVVISGIK